MLTGREKATIFLSILGAETAARVLRYLPEELADIIASGINHLPTPSPEALSEVLSDYQSHLALPSAAPYSPSADTFTPPPDLAGPAYRPYGPSGQGGEEAKPKKSYALLMYERPQMAAFLLSLLPGDEREGALQALPRERAVVEELFKTLKPNVLHSRLEAGLRETFSGKLF